MPNRLNAREIINICKHSPNKPFLYATDENYAFWLIFEFKITEVR